MMLLEPGESHQRSTIKHKIGSMAMVSFIFVMEIKWLREKAGLHKPLARVAEAPKPAGLDVVKNPVFV